MMRSQVIRDSDPAGLIARFTMPPAFFKRVNETRFKQEWKLSAFQHWCLRKGWNGEGDPWAFYRYFMYLTRNIKLPKYQRGIFSIFPGGTGAANAVSGSVVLNTHSATAFASSGTARCGIEFENNGGLQHDRTPGSNTDYSGEWWSNEPDGSIGDDYAVRHLSSGKSGTWNASESATADNWVTITTLRQWANSRSSFGTTTTSATFEVGPEPSGPNDDSATITCVSDWDNS